MGNAKVVSKVVQEVQVEQTAVVLDKTQEAVINEFFTTRNTVNELKKTQKALEAQVKEIIGDAEVGLVDGQVRIQQSFRSKSGIDMEKLKTAFPEAFEACQTSSPYVVLVAK